MNRYVCLHHADNYLRSMHSIVRFSDPIRVYISLWSIQENTFASIRHPPIAQFHVGLPASWGITNVVR